MLEKGLEQLKDKKQPLSELVNSQRKDLRSQLNRFTQTLDKMLNEDKTLAGRIKTLFREQGVTVKSIILAISMTVSTIVLYRVSFNWWFWGY